jgi:flagellar basal-body rod protein FlgB
MIGKLDETFSFQSQALLLRAQRQQLLASNIANADTPGYSAQDFNFPTALRAATGEASAAGASRGMKLTNANHLEAPGSGSGVTAQYRMPAQSSLDRNSVDMDAERAQFADNAVRYEAALRFLNQQIKTMLSAIQG